MLDAAVKALSQILSPPMRSILWRSIGLALVLITVLAIGLQRLLSWFATYGEDWAEAMLGSSFHAPLNVLAWIVSIARSSRLVSTRSAAEKSSCRVSGDGTATQAMPAALAARTPFVLSSSATQASGGTLSRSAARR